MVNYRRNLWADETGLPWVNPSPNIRSAEAAALYVGLGILESANLSVGRGTDQPFSLYGAPWVNSRAWLREIERRGGIPGLELTALSFTPSASTYAGQICQGLQVKLINRSQYDGFRTAIVVLQALQALYPGKLKVDDTVTMAGDRSFPDSIRSLEPPEAILARWRAQIDREFIRGRARFLLYL